MRQGAVAALAAVVATGRHYAIGGESTPRLSVSAANESLAPAR